MALVPYPIFKRYPIPIYRPSYDIPPGSCETCPPGTLRHNFTGTVYGSCDCSIGSGYPTRNDCQDGYPICTPTGCMCYNVPLGQAGCFNERGSSC